MSEMASVVASLHYLALGIGLGSVFVRARSFNRLAKGETVLATVLTADNFWGIAALLWIVSGLARAFAGLEKGTGFYLASPLFHLKMGLFLLIFLLELMPMIALIKWRIKPAEHFDSAKARLFARISDLETLLIILIVFVAGAMARGVGLK